jgi:hypothetical protein
VAIPADHDERITRFYLDQAERLRRAIAFKRCGLGDAIIEDACAFAWETLLGRPGHRPRRPRGLLVALQSGRFVAVCSGRHDPVSFRRLGLKTALESQKPRLWAPPEY